jgi:hypothetical protein
MSAIRSKIARKAAELAALEREAADEEAELAAERAVGLVIDLHVPADLMAKLADRHRIADLEDREAFSKAVAAAIAPALNPPKKPAPIPSLAELNDRVERASGMILRYSIYSRG